MENKKLGIALLGLGKYSANQLAPALQQTKECYLSGVITGTPAKARAWKQQYSLKEKNIYTYDNLDQIADNPDIDIVYIVLPNSLHADYTIKIAKTGKHIICEKPMATSVADAQKMIHACKENNVQLAIGYRLHYEPFNKRVMELGQKELFGKITALQAHFGMDMTKEGVDVWRLRKDLAGGGPLMDLGIYCVQAVCYTVGKTPVAVTARFGEITNPAYFYDVEESIEWTMEFDTGLVANCKTSYSIKDEILHAKAEKGWWKLGPVFDYSDKKGETSEGKMDFPNIFEQAAQMDSMAQSFRRKEHAVTPGEMGLRDMKILMAIYESAKSGGSKINIE